MTCVEFFKATYTPHFKKSKKCTSDYNQENYSSYISKKIKIKSEVYV